MKKNYDRSRRKRKSAVAGSLGKGGTAQDQGGKEAAPARDIQLPLDRIELITMIQDEVHSFAVSAGLVIAKILLQDEIDQLCGERYTRQDDRIASRCGSQEGYVVIAGQKIRLERPRARYKDGSGEVPRERYGMMQREEALPETCLGTERRDPTMPNPREAKRQGAPARKALGRVRSHGESGLPRATITRRR